MLRKIIAFLISFCFLFEQIGFAQVAGPLGIPAYLNNFAPVADKFRPVHLRALSFDQAQNNFDLLLDKGNNLNLSQPQISATASKLLEYFQIGLRLPNSAFWVNLRPDAPTDVIDPLLEKTDIGQIMLAADLELKKDMAGLTSPDTVEGRKYWDALYEKASSLYGPQDITVPALTRPWIVPGEIIIQETAQGAYILKATLKVMLEQDYLQGSVQYSFEDENSRILNDYSSQLLRDLIIPKLTKEVNASRKYADLRQVYYSLIMAQWFKQKFRGSPGKYFSRIDARILPVWFPDLPGRRILILRLTKNLFPRASIISRSRFMTLYGPTVRNYFSGGMDLKADISAAAFKILPAGAASGFAKLFGGLTGYLARVSVDQAGTAEFIPEESHSAGFEGGIGLRRDGGESPEENLKYYHAAGSSFYNGISSVDAVLGILNTGKITGEWGGWVSQGSYLRSTDPQKRGFLILEIDHPLDVVGEEGRVKNWFTGRVTKDNWDGAIDISAALKAKKIRIISLIDLNDEKIKDLRKELDGNGFADIPIDPAPAGKDGGEGISADQYRLLKQNITELRGLAGKISELSRKPDAGKIKELPKFTGLVSALSEERIAAIQRNLEEGASVSRDTRNLDKITATVKARLEKTAGTYNAAL